MNIADPDRTAGTGQTETVRLAFDPDNPTLRPTDEQVDGLLNNLDEYATIHADLFWNKYGRTLLGLPTDIPNEMAEMRTAVREWLAKIGC